MVDVREYLDRKGNSPYAIWFDGLNAEAAVKVTMAVTRLGQGNFSKVKGVGSGVFEYRIDFGPGYRIYLGKDGDCLVILLGGGTKKRQKQTSAWQLPGGKTTSRERKRGIGNGFDPRF